MLGRPEGNHQEAAAPTSYNLSQGTIQDPSRVQQYGDVIQREARRLINQSSECLALRVFNRVVEFMTHNRPT